jgi:hypothetical protein
MLYKCVRKQGGMGSTPAKTPAEFFLMNKLSSIFHQENRFDIYIKSGISACPQK